MRKCASVNVRRYRMRIAVLGCQTWERVHRGWNTLLPFWEWGIRYLIYPHVVDTGDVLAGSAGWRALIRRRLGENCGVHVGFVEIVDDG